jgi:lipopolysaccharide export system permease protein
MVELLAKSDGYARGELLWRIALPLMALALMLLAIPLSFVNPRAGRSLGLLVALLLFVVYSNTVSVFQASVAQQRMSFMMAWWPVHVIVAAAGGGHVRPAPEHQPSLPPIPVVEPRAPRHDVPARGLR